MLEYENEVLLNCVQEDALNVFAKGIPLNQALSSIFRIYSSEMNMVLVLSSNPNEEVYYLNQLSEEKIVSVTTEYSSQERKDLYGTGGVFFVTSRILVVDFLKDVIPAEKITGVIVLRAHNLIETTQEAFILRLYRSKNKTGFIKAFSQSPEAFILGFSRLNRVMRCCFLANVSLWPRFHSSVKQSLAKASQDVEEIQLRLTEPMREIQTNLLDLVSYSISELKRLVPALNDDDVTAETALTKGFEKIVSAYVDPVWNTISTKSKDILNDIKIFRLLLTQLTKVDCVTFFSTLCLYTSKDAVLKSSWVLAKPAELVITAAKGRLFPTKSKKGGSDSSNSSKNFQPEIQPKWLALSEIVEETSKRNDERKKEGEEGSFGAALKTLIFSEDARTCAVLKDYLCYGSEATMARIAKNCENIKVELPSELAMKLDNIQHENKGVKRFKRGGLRGVKKGNNGDSSDDDEQANTSKGPSEVQITLTQINRKYEEIEFLQTPIFIRPVKSLWDSEVYAISETLQQLMPDVIIIMDPSLDLVRTIEVHRARVAGTQEIKVYFLSFHNSVEEQIYLTSIQREKRAFEVLIQEKSTMVVPNEREARDELNQDLWRDPTKANETVGAGAQSKRNMLMDDKVRHVALVDMREFRSELPSLIHKRGIDLEPLTLDVGDYILTPDICVERKSISDLVGSLNSGRLYKQAEAMTRHYKKPVVLIEHEQQAKTVSKGSKYRNDLADIMPKLQLLTMKFPKLKLIWSPGAHYTSELFHELKRGKEQPDPEKALMIQKEACGDHSTSKYNLVAHNFLSKMPGVDSRNIYTLLNRGGSLDNLSKMSEAELTDLLENSQAASLLYSGFHSNLLEASGGISSLTDDKKGKPTSKPKPSSYRVALKPSKP